MEKKYGVEIVEEDYQLVLARVFYFSILSISSLLIFITLTGSSSGFWVSLRSSKLADYILPLEALQRKLSPHDDYDQARPVSSAPSPFYNSSFSPNNLTSNHKSTITSKYQMLEQGLAKAQDAIRKAAMKKNKSAFSNTTVYHNYNLFYQSYVEMEKRLKVYVYEEGQQPLVHRGPCKGKYSSEGKFIQEMEFGGNGFRTKDPNVAHLYFMPFSVKQMVQYLWVQGSRDMQPLVDFTSDYLRVISKKHPFWNRTYGADHFMISCHDWAPQISSRADPFLCNTSIRVLCNAKLSKGGFNPQKDVSLAAVNLDDGSIPPKLRSIPPNNTRPYLGFFAGGVHGDIRPILLKHWKDRDNDIRVFEYLPKDLDYSTFLLQSKFCLCPSGHEVYSPRIVEAIYAECVPVIISEQYVLPFSDVLNWEEFSIKVKVSDIPVLKQVLMAVPEDKYLRMKKGCKVVKRHFVFNQPAQRFDLFHMILHSVWLRRLNFRLGT